MLYIVPTPIGNLEDVTLRALRVLKEADVVACEDTRTTAVLMGRYDISTPRISYHDHNERRRTPQLIERLQAGETVALVSDAGTPGISDPGFYLVRECIRNDIPVEALPGATAFVPALVASGLPTDRFVFEGFLPAKKGRNSRLKQLATDERTVVFYESPHRLVKMLEQLSAHFGGDRPASVSREVTKKFEETIRGTLNELLTYFSAQTKVRGEIVIIVGGARTTTPTEDPESPTETQQ